MLRITRLQGLRCTCIDVDGDGLIDHGDIARLHSYAERSIAGPIIYAQPRAAGAALSAEDVDRGNVCLTALASGEISLACRLNERINVFAIVRVRKS